MSIQLFEWNSVQAGLAGPDLTSPWVSINGQHLTIPAMSDWFDGIELYDGVEWHAAQLLVHISSPNTPETVANRVGASSSLAVRVRLVDGCVDCDARQLRFWQLRLASTSERTLSACDWESSPTISTDPYPSDVDLVALPAPWVAAHSIGPLHRWFARSINGIDVMELEFFPIDPEYIQQLVQALDVCASTPHPALRPLHQVWHWRGGVIVGQSPLDSEDWQTLVEASLAGEIDGPQLLEAWRQSAEALTHLERIGAGAHGQVCLENMLWNGAKVQLQRACFPHAMVPDVRGAEGPMLETREKGRNALETSQSDQYALAQAYLKARRVTHSRQGTPSEADLQDVHPAERNVLLRALDSDPFARWPSSTSFVEALADATGVPQSLSLGTPQSRPAIEGLLGLERYRSLFCGQPPPTKAQIANFVDYVARKHSWYKHLPLTPPGKRFLIYLDPGAGMQRFKHADGAQGYREIQADASLFHHAQLPTEEYRRRFGLLNVLDRGAPDFSLHSAAEVAYFEAAPGVLVDGKPMSVPAEVAFLGSVMVTGVLHDRSSEAWLWERQFKWLGRKAGDNLEPELRWPRASGGIAIVEAIRRILREPAPTYRFFESAVDYLIAPERERQKRLMRQGAERIIALVYGNLD